MSWVTRKSVTDTTGGIAQSFPESGAPGAHSPEQVDRDGYGEYDEFAVNCAQCGAYMADSRLYSECWLCGGDNFLGDPWP